MEVSIELKIKEMSAVSLIVKADSEFSKLYYDKQEIKSVTGLFNDILNTQFAYGLGQSLGGYLAKLSEREIKKEEFNEH